MRQHPGSSSRGTRLSDSRLSGLVAERRILGTASPDDALTMAVRLYRSPGLARSVRVSALPPAVLPVIRIAAGCPISTAYAVAQTGMDAPTLSRIAALYLLVALFGQESDPHRTLGLGPEASGELVQDHRKWLLKWLHPDRNPNQHLAGLSVRVLDASAALSAAPAPVEPLPASPAPAAAAPAEGEPSRRKRQLRHVWLPLQLDG